MPCMRHTPATNRETRFRISCKPGHRSRQSFYIGRWHEHDILGATNELRDSPGKSRNQCAPAGESLANRGWACIAVLRWNNNNVRATDLGARVIESSKKNEIVT